MIEKKGDEMTTVAVKGETKVARPLRVLVPLIKEELTAGYSAGLEHYRRAGDMLLEAKSQVGHGEWQPWLKRNFELSARQASDYMRLAREMREAENGGNAAVFRARTLSEAVGDLRSPGEKFASWVPPVREVISRVNVERLAEERQSREREAKLIKQLAYQLIDIGYRVLATKLHPDKPGGSDEAMTRLNKVRRLLKEAV
jgi:hypothetical protein